MEKRKLRFDDLGKVLGLFGRIESPYMVSVEPLVVKHLIDGQALGWLLFKQSREQVFSLLAESC